MKKSKIFFSISAVGSVIAPVAIAVSCNEKTNQNNIKKAANEITTNIENFLSGTLANTPNIPTIDKNQIKSNVLNLLNTINDISTKANTSINYQSLSTFINKVMNYYSTVFSSKITAALTRGLTGAINNNSNEFLEKLNNQEFVDSEFNKIPGSSSFEQKYTELKQIINQVLDYIKNNIDNQTLINKYLDLYKKLIGFYSVIYPNIPMNNVLPNTANIAPSAQEIQFIKNSITEATKNFNNQFDTVYKNEFKKNFVMINHEIKNEKDKFTLNEIYDVVLPISKMIKYLVTNIDELTKLIDQYLSFVSKTLKPANQ
ncbi:hypothetical protein GE118_02025 [Mycoplasma sp. NEAQ87857]|uniref:Vmc-like lipoprotein signal peptide domain-containing protein n=1 Tax=Mycoplasma sp. NEAQ87857 TaxID=2683967 RepID=UPI00131991AA|nr:hypothetical protein [Mycoplasma sp. NEAQ87857]QGZ97572.1 hypothetical protein GE118_02025 [Mycoplasma sp. NEAQ87857]